MKLVVTESENKNWSVQNRREYVFLNEDEEEMKVVNLYPSVLDQTMEGFGGAITDAAAYVFSKMTKEAKDELLHQYFSSDEMNYQLIRMHMDSCDFSTHMYSAVEDETDEHLNSFSFEYTEKYMIPMLDAIEKKAKRKMKLMLSAWSPPAFMKTNGQRKQGGSLKPEFRERWAQYICRYIKEFRKRGYEVERISIQNEPKAVQAWDSCVYSAQEEKLFLRDYLYPALKEHGLEQVEVFIWDHNKERVYERAEAIIDEKTDAMIAGVAFHWYSGDHFEALDLIRKRYPDKKLILSESCLELGAYNQSRLGEDGSGLAHDLIGNLNHGMSSFYDWNLVLDETGGPNHVGNNCDAPYLYHEKEGWLERRMSLQYYWHFSHYIKPNAVRISHTSYTSDLEVTAWQNPDGERVVIMLNRTGQDLPCVLRMEGKTVRFEVKAQSILSGRIEMENE